MQVWAVQDAKARFSELVDCAVSEGPQQLTRHGAPTAVLVSYAQWERMGQANDQNTFKSLLLAPHGRFELEIPKRKAMKRRSVPVFD